MADKPLADHPDEERLRQAEDELAETLEDLSKRAVAALRDHDRINAVVLLSQLASTSDIARRAQAKAIGDQMKATKH
jgi:hypothetical protein